MKSGAPFVFLRASFDIRCSASARLIPPSSFVSLEQPPSPHYDAGARPRGGEGRNRGTCLTVAPERERAPPFLSIVSPRSTMAPLCVLLAHSLWFARNLQGTLRGVSPLASWGLTATMRFRLHYDSTTCSYPCPTCPLTTRMLGSYSWPHVFHLLNSLAFDLSNFCAQHWKQDIREIESAMVR